MNMEPYTNSGPIRPLQYPKHSPQWHSCCKQRVPELFASTSAVVYASPPGCRCADRLRNAGDDDIEARRGRAERTLVAANTHIRHTRKLMLNCFIRTCFQLSMCLAQYNLLNGQNVKRASVSLRSKYAWLFFDRLNEPC